MILDFFGIAIRASRFFCVLSKLRGMAIYTKKIRFSEKNNKLVFHSSVIVTKGFGCFWGTFGGVRGPPGTQ